MMIFLCKRDPEVILPKSIPDIPGMDTHLQHTRWSGGDYMGKSVGMSILMDRVLLDQIAGQWNLLILSAMCDHEGRARFNVLKRSVPGISQKMLTQCLRQLERSGLVARLVLTESPVGVEYSLTKLGETLHAPVAALCRWTGKHSAAVLDAQKSFDAKKATHKSNPHQ
jgi:DNA-binding HxlR family transcriptional regulator